MQGNVGLLGQVFSSEGFMPRWECGDWSSAHGWLHILSDAAIFGAYLAIPCVLGFFLWKRRDIPFPGILVLFAAFILFCGMTHLLDAIIFFDPMYRFSGLLKVGTALVSWATVLALVPIVPKALTLRSPAELAREVDAQTHELQRSQDELARTNHALHETNQEMEQFVYMVSHDLKAPVVTLGGFLNVLREELDDGNKAGVLDAVGRLERATNRMQSRINDLLTLSRVGHVRREAAPVDLNDVAAHVVSELDLQIKDAQAIVRVAPDLPTVHGDQAQIAQALENLVTNALKHACREPGRAVEIGAHKKDNEVHVFVRDEGPGVPTKDQSRIFGVFERGSAEVPGTGIGLAIVAKIARIHGGRAWVDSDGASGATFFMAFPDA